MSDEKKSRSPFARVELNIGWAVGKGLPDPKKAPVTIDGVPIQGVKSILVRAGVGEATEVTITMLADVDGVVDGKFIARRELVQQALPSKIPVGFVEVPNHRPAIDRCTEKFGVGTDARGNGWEVREEGRTKICPVCGAPPTEFFASVPPAYRCSGTGSHVWEENQRAHDARYEIRYWDALRRVDRCGGWSLTREEARTVALAVLRSDLSVTDIRILDKQTREVFRGVDGG